MWCQQSVVHSTHGHVAGTRSSTQGKGAGTWGEEGELFYHLALEVALSSPEIKFVHLVPTTTYAKNGGQWLKFKPLGSVAASSSKFNYPGVRLGVAEYLFLTARWLGGQILVEHDMLFAGARERIIMDHGTSELEGAHSNHPILQMRLPSR